MKRGYIQSSKMSVDRSALNPKLSNVMLYQQQIPQLRMLKSQMAKAYCSIGEIYLTDLCYEENAEEKCEEAIGRAIAVDEDSMDGQQGVSRILFSHRRSLLCALLLRNSYVLSCFPSFGESAHKSVSNRRGWSYNRSRFPSSKSNQGQSLS